MPKLSVGEKAHRAVDFLMGVSNWQVQRAMGSFGFGQRALDEGWARLRNLTTDKLQISSSLVDPRLVGALDAWENRWFPIVEIVLRTNFLGVHELVFRNLRPDEGVGGRRLGRDADRSARADRQADPTRAVWVRRGQAACSLLVERGVTERVLTDARDLLAHVGSAKEPDLLESEDPEAVAAAEESLWRWYLEWSGIARIAIRDRRLLRALGFLKTVRRPDGTEEEVVVNDDEELDTDPPVPTPTPQPTPPPPPFVTDDPTEV